MQRRNRAIWMLAISMVLLAIRQQHQSEGDLMATVGKRSRSNLSRHDKQRWLHYGLAGMLAMGLEVLCPSPARAQQQPPLVQRQPLHPAIQNDLRNPTATQQVGYSPSPQPISPVHAGAPNFAAPPNPIGSAVPNAQSGGASLQTYNVPSAMIGTVGAHLQLQYHGQPGVTVTTDPNTQQLMVMAPQAIQAEIADSIQRLLADQQISTGDRGQAAGTHQESTYTLNNLTWRELEDSLRRLSGSKMTVTTERDGELAMLKLQNQFGVYDLFRIDRRANQVTMIGTRPTVSAWMQVVYSLDNGHVDAEESTHVVPLAPAQPRNIRKMLRLVKANLRAQQEDEEDFFDDDPAPDDSRPNLPFQDNPNPDDPATAIFGVDDTLTAASGLLGDVQIEIIDDLGLIIVKGSKRDVQRTLQVIDQIKAQAKMTEPAIDVLQLKHANSEAVAAEVTRLYESVYQARQGTVSITALVQPNALLIIGRQEIVDSVKTLVDKLDQPLEAHDQLKVIRLQHASAVDLEGRVRDFFVQQPGVSQDNRAALGTRVRVLSDYRTNALIVQAAPRELAEVEKLIVELDVEGNNTENRVQVFRLRHALAAELQEVIQAIISGQTTDGASGGAGGGSPTSASTPSGKLSMVTVDGGKVDSGILAGVVVTADPTVNALVITAPVASIPLLAKLIEELDSLPSAEAQVKIFQLKNSDATNVALTLQNLYGLAPTAGQGAQFSLQNNFVNNLGLTAGGESSLVQLRVTPEARTNSVIVSGGQADLRVLEAMILRLDEDIADSRRFEVIWLRNATAENVATALETYFTNYLQSQNNLVTTGVISAQELINRQVLVVPEVATNSLLISANRELFDIAIRLIERMDRRPPMVAIQVLIAEIQLDDSFELGAEWGVQDSLLFNRGSATGGTLASPIFALGNTLASPTSAENLAGQALSNFGVGRTSTGGPGGLVLSASSESVGVLLRALQTAGRVQVLNRPQLTTMDQQEASAQVGAIVPRVTGITQAQIGVPQQVQTTDADVGLLLSVLPRVSPDGLILMQVGVEHSSVGDPAVGIPIGFGANGEVIRSPIINRTRADTVVSAYSGQTVVFAGLISKERASQRTQIPLLGSIPWIGAAFRFDVETETRKELLVVLTPRLVQTDEDYETLKHVETSRMSWCLADVLNIHGDETLSGGNGLWGPARGEVLYPQAYPEPLPDRAIHHLDNQYPMGAPGYPADSRGYPTHGQVGGTPVHGNQQLVPGQQGIPGPQGGIEFLPQSTGGAGYPQGVLEAVPMDQLNLDSRRMQQPTFPQGGYQHAATPQPALQVQPAMYSAPR